MSKIKFLARSIVLLATIQSIEVSGEYYVVQPGDVLSSIANQKLSKSDLPINLEQVMLTIYKLNPDVFIDGNVDRVLPGKRIYIPDNVADFVQLSKSEAQRRLHDRNYLRGLYSSSNKLKLMGSSGWQGTPGSSMQDYGQILQTLENHQQNIDILKIENAHLSKSFKLLERALGRIVIIQGLLTNDVVKVKSKLFGGSASVSIPVVPDDVVAENDSSALTDNASVSLPKVEENITKSVVPDNSPVDVVGQLAAGDQNNGSGDQLGKPVALDATGLANNPNRLNSGHVIQENTTESLPIKKIKPNKEALEESGMWLDIAMLAAVLLPLLLLLLWILDFKKIRSKLMPSKTAADMVATAPKFSIKDRLVPNSENNRYTLNDPSIGEPHGAVEPIRIKTEKSIKENSLVDRNTEMTGVMELLDMCLLFGDYQQAHSVTLKAIADYQSSPLLSKKLALIERKLSKY